MSSKRATIRQKRAFDLTLETIKNDRVPKTKKQILVEAGYGKVAEQPSRVFESQGFKKLLARIDDNVILARVEEILLGDDKRSSLTAAEMLLKLKDRFPASKSKVVGLFEAVKGLREDGED